MPLANKDLTDARKYLVNLMLSRVYRLGRATKMPSTNIEIIVIGIFLRRFPKSENHVRWSTFHELEAVTFQVDKRQFFFMRV